MPLAFKYDRYLKQITALTNQATTISNAYQIFISAAAQQRCWQIPDFGLSVAQAAAANITTQVTGPWNYSIFNLSGNYSIIAAFDRTQINNEYAKILMTGGLDGGGRIADVKVNKAQLEYVAAEERAVTLRYMSPTRAAFHASARRSGHGNSSGIFGTMQRDLDNTLLSGYGGGSVSAFE